MKKENTSVDFRLQKIDDPRKYFLEEINHNQFVSKETFNYIEHLLILTSTVTGCISIFAFSYLVDIAAEITSSAIELQISVSKTGIKKFKSIIKRKRKNT